MAKDPEEWFRQAVVKDILFKSREVLEWIKYQR